MDKQTHRQSYLYEKVNKNKNKQMKQLKSIVICQTTEVNFLLKNTKLKIYIQNRDVAHTIKEIRNFFLYEKFNKGDPPSHKFQ